MLILLQYNSEKQREHLNSVLVKPVTLNNLYQMYDLSLLSADKPLIKAMAQSVPLSK